MLLAADPVITEFMASNESILEDGHGESSDWIELYNRGDEAVNLSGWYLTDNSQDLTQWAFPDLTLNANEYAIVFASDRGVPDPQGNLHTNFRLSTGGDYLALVQPDGQTIASEFEDPYPTQLTDISYGRTMVDEEIRFVASSTSAQILIPTDDSLGTDWTQPSFVPDANWISQLADGQPVKAAVGFGANSDFDGHFESDIQALLQGKNAGAYLRIPFTVDNPGEVEELTLRMKFDDGYLVYLNGNLIDIQNAPLFTSYNSTASEPRSNEEAVVFDEVDVSDYRGYLVPGNNILAIHGMNYSVDDPDFLIVPELSTTRVRVIDSPAGFFSNVTPGGRNPDRFSLAPVVESVIHTPTQPTISDPLVVQAKVRRTVEDVASVVLTYRVMYGDHVDIAMADTGTGQDEVAGDGIYTAVIPAAVAEAGEMLRYRVTASDTTGETLTFPRVLDTTGTDRSPEYFGTVIVDPTLTSELPLLQWFTESVSRARSRTGARASVYYAGEFYDNIFVRQRGGATNASSQKFNFGDDQPFYVNEQLGRVREFNMNAQGSDSSYLRQTLAFESYAAAGNESSSSFLVWMRVNGRPDRVGVFIEQVDEDFLQRYDLDSEGALYKFVQRSNLEPVFRDTITGIEKKTRLDEGKDDIQEVVNGLNRATLSDRAKAVFDQFNVAQLLNYLAVRSVTMEADDVRKNFYLYRDTNGTQQWSIFPWDKDWTFGVVGDGGTHLAHPFFGDYAHRKQNADQWNLLYDTVFNDPVLREMYLRRLRTVMDTMLQPPGTSAEEGIFENRLDALYAQAAAQLPRSVASIVESAKGFFPQRRQTLYVDHSIDLLAPGEIKDLIPEYATDIQYFVPANNDLGTSWTGVQNPSNIAAWSTGDLGLGFENRTTFSELIRTTVRPTDACSECTSIYLRIPFVVSDPSAIEALTLRMKYDDGFVAYLNGTEVARGNFTGTPAYDSEARTRVTSAALQYEDFVLDDYRGLLQPGQNVLAIHSLNSSSTSSDQMIFPVLIDGRIGDESAAGIPHAQVGNPTIEFGDFDQDPVSGDQDQEFIELKNPNNTAVDISGWSLTGGIEHTFPAGTVIPANRSLYVTPSVPAFRARVDGPRGDQGLFIQGNYRGHLSNFGETVLLITSDGAQMDALQTPVEPTDVQQFLRISEIHYNPPGAEDATEFIELVNISQGTNATTLDLQGVTISAGPSEPFVFPAGRQLAPGQRLVVVKDLVAFSAAYPNVESNRIAGVFLGSLDNVGERIKLDDARGNTVVDFRYDENAMWPQSADGAGASLELIAPENTPVSLLDKSYVWRGSSEFGGSPAQAGAGPRGVLISEVVSNSGNTTPRGDAIELWNSTANPIDISGWYLSDSAGDLLKYAIPAGTILAPGQYRVFGEADFNSPTNGDRAFALSGTEGDDVWLTIASQGTVQTIVDDVHFGPSVAGESFGITSASMERLLPLTHPTLGASNAAPRVGPVVISEVQYHPAAPTSAALEIAPDLDGEDLEFVEILNPTDQNLDLSRWRLRGGIEYTFDDGTSLNAGESILVLRFNPSREDNAARTEAFRVHYDIDASTRLVGGYAGQLSDSQDRIQLQRASSPAVQDPIYLFEDEVTYDDRNPWPESADGNGMSLQRRSISSSGNEAQNWLAAEPTPGVAGTVASDLNGDGVVDEGDILRLCEAIEMDDPQYDLDRSGQTNFADMEFYVWNVLNTHFGDSNVDGIFNTRDLVLVLQAGEYEDGIPGNSTWAEGDWDCDGDFTTNDLVLALRDGGYTYASLPASDPMPSPVALVNLASAMTAEDSASHGHHTPTRLHLRTHSTDQAVREEWGSTHEPEASLFRPHLRRRAFTQQSMIPPMIDSALRQLWSDCDLDDPNEPLG